MFKYTPYDELRRLGLDAATEAACAAPIPKLTGMLVVDEVQPGSAADGVLVARRHSDCDRRQAGAGVLRPGGRARQSGRAAKSRSRCSAATRRCATRSRCESLGAITADEYIEFGEAVVHTLSYQQARHYNLPIKGVYVANPGYVFGSAGIPHGALISAFNGKKIETLARFRGGAWPELGGRRARAGALRDARGSAHHAAQGDPHGPALVSGAQMQARRRARHLAVRGARRRARGRAPLKPASTQYAKTGDPRIDRLAPSLVMVTFDMPYSVSGVTEKNYHGTGVIVDAKRGLVVIDRNTVPVAMGDVRITFNGTVEVPGKVEFIHPLHNLAVVSYDPRLIGDTPVRAATLRRPRRCGRATTCGSSASAAIPRSCRERTQVAGVDAVAFPLSRTLRFRDSNLEVVNLVNAPADLDGVLADDKGEVLALWSSFAFETQRELEQVNRGIPADLVTEMINVVADGRPLYSFEAEFDVAVAGRRAQARADRRLGQSLRAARSGSGARCSASIGWSPARPPRRCSSPATCLLAIDGKVGEPLPRSGARRAEARGCGHGVARRRREDAADEDRGAQRTGHRPGA